MRGLKSCLGIGQNDPGRRQLQIGENTVEVCVGAI